MNDVAYVESFRSAPQLEEMVCEELRDTECLPSLSD